MQLLHLLHAIALAGQVLRHWVALAAVQEAVGDADVAGGGPAARLGHRRQQHPALPLGAVAVRLLAVLLVHVVAVLPASDDEDVLVEVADGGALDAGDLGRQALQDLVGDPRADLLPRHFVPYGVAFRTTGRRVVEVSGSDGHLENAVVVNQR